MNITYYTKLKLNNYTTLAFRFYQIIVLAISEYTTSTANSTDSLLLLLLFCFDATKILPFPIERSTLLSNKYQFSHKS